MGSGKGAFGRSLGNPQVSPRRCDPAILGHGQHQASAILGKEAFSAAADKDRFPEQLRYVRPWQAKRLLFNVFSFNAEQEKEAREMPRRVDVDTGEFNPVLG